MCQRETMKFKAKINGFMRDFKSGKPLIQIEPMETIDYESLGNLADGYLDIEIKKHRERRSLDANALLWHCIGNIASALRADKWKIYLQMLKRYGKYTYICVKPSVVEAVKAQWRECEELGEININGSKAVQMLCYFGSSTYDTQEMSVLIDGVIDEMKQMGLEPPMPKEIRLALERYEKERR